MTFKIDRRRIQELVQIEEEINCDIGTGLTNPINYINRDKLIALLQDELNGHLPAEEIEAIASDVQNQVRRRIVQRKPA